MNPLPGWISLLGLDDPLIYAVLFLAACALLIWRLDAMMRHGLDGTSLGALIMPWCSGLPNLIFVFIMLRQENGAAEVAVNTVVNNVTNLSLLLGLPALIWGLDVLPPASGNAGAKRGKKASRKSKADTTSPRLNRLALLLSVVAGLFFTGACWALGNDGSLDRSDGLVLVGLFLFWQAFHLYEVSRQNLHAERSFSPWFYVDLFLSLIGGWLLYTSIDWLVNWISTIETGFFRASRMGWLSGWLMVLPNALPAFYYAWRRRADVVYSSQIGDGHICIPLALGLFAVFSPMILPPIFMTGLVAVAAALLIHLILLVGPGRLPKAAGGLLLIGYAVFVVIGLPS